MPGIFDRISALAGSDVEKAANLAHQTYQGGMGEHGHHGRAFIETLATLCRNHPNIVGIGVGLLVEQLLSEEKREHDRRVAQAPAPVVPAAPVLIEGAEGVEGEVAPGAAAAAPVVAPVPAPAPPAHEHHRLEAATRRIQHVKPGKLAMEVFGALLLLKFGAAFSHARHRKRHEPDGWLVAASRIHLLSATLAAYYFAKSLRSEKVSAWRNAAIGLFGTDALKPLLKAQKAARRG